MGRETEFKFMVEAGSPGDVLDWAAKAGLMKGRPQQRHLDNYYYDTPDFRLRQAGIALRTRCSDGKWELTVKTRAGASDGKTGGVHVHPEYNAAVNGKPEKPDLSLFPAEIFQDLPRSEIQDNLREFMSQRCLRTVFIIAGTTPVHEDFVIEASFDEVVYQGKHGGIPGKELELELKEGTVNALLYVSAILLAAEKASEMPLKLRIGSVSKMQRAAIYAGIIPAGEPEQADLSSDRGRCRALSGLERICFLEEDAIRAAQAFKSLEDLFRKVRANPLSSPFQEALERLARDYEEKKLPDLPLPQRKEVLKQLLTDPDLVLARLRLDAAYSLSSPSSGRN
ncbi:inorganic triphosphatase [Succinimonas sp.]|uniref:CYTH domain-containing protein n=1 Tax=Succinimonas sp. TaxID=1936151 RepID=UPI0038700F0E